MVMVVVAMVMLRTVLSPGQALPPQHQTRVPCAPPPRAGAWQPPGGDELHHPEHHHVALRDLLGSSERAPLGFGAAQRGGAVGGCGGASGEGRLLRSVLARRWAPGPAGALVGAGCARARGVGRGLGVRVVWGAGARQLRGRAALGPCTLPLPALCPLP